MLPHQMKFNKDNVAPHTTVLQPYMHVWLLDAHNIVAKAHITGDQEIECA